MNRQKAFLVGGLALEMLLTPIIGAIAGDYLDRYLSTKPWFFWVGLLMGCGSAARIGMRLYRIGKSAMENKDGDDKP